jgi:hypothetical protein
MTRATPPGTAMHPAAATATSPVRITVIVRRCNRVRIVSTSGLYDVRTGARIYDEPGEWDGRPYTTAGSKSAHARVQRVDQPASATDRTWGAHERIAVRRAQASNPVDSRSLDGVIVVDRVAADVVEYLKSL